MKTYSLPMKKHFANLTSTTLIEREMDYLTFKKTNNTLKVISIYKALIRECNFNDFLVILFKECLIKF